MDIQLGRSRTVRRAYGIDEIALVPGGRTVDPAVTDSSWTLGGVSREIPIIASAMDGVVDVGMCVELTKQGALGVLNLEGVQCRYDDPNPALDRIAAVGKEEFVPLMQELYSQPVREDLIRKRIAEIKERGGIGKITATKEEEESNKSIKEHKEAKTQMLKKILQANAKSAQTIVQVDDQFVLNTVAEGKKEGMFEFAVCVNPGGNERRVVRFFKVNQATESQLLNLISEASMPDDLEAMQEKLDVLREKLGITSGWGMKPGDKGYQPGGLPAINGAVQPEAMLNAPTEVNHVVAGVAVKAPF